jgi:ABC-type glutathione transport system ATPase component
VSDDHETPGRQGPDDDLRHALGSLPAVGGVSFDLNENETLGIVGESGSGKTVLSRTIMGLQPRATSRSAGRCSQWLRSRRGQREGEARDLGS